MTEPERLDRSQWEPFLDETFPGPGLDRARWLPHYLPQWTTPGRSAARYDLERGLLRLRIDADQPAWRPEDGELRVSNVQTGSSSGPLGSPLGQHRHRTDLRVRTPQPTRRLVAPVAGPAGSESVLAEAVLRATADPTLLLAFWLIGVEDSPDQSGEICVAELFGHSVGRERSAVRLGVKAHHDPRLSDDMTDVTLDLDASDWHTYSAEWTAGRVRFFVDDALVHEVPQGVDYPMQLMVDLFEFPAGPDRDPADYPKTGDVAAVRVHRPAAGRGRP